MERSSASPDPWATADASSGIQAWGSPADAPPADLPATADASWDIEGSPEIHPTAQPSSLGAGELILVCRELIGLSQRRLAARVGTSQPTLARLETGNRIPTLRTLMRVTEAAGFELVIGLRRPEVERPDPDWLRAMGFALLGSLLRNAEDDLADFVALREPSSLEGPR